MLPPYVERYVTDHNREFLQEISSYLPEFTFEEASRFYRWLEGRAAKGLIEPETEAAIGLIDRYYLLTVLCGRKKLMVDEQTEYGRIWLYDRCREVEKDPNGHLDLWAREHFKAQRLDEPTPTPDGWKLHGELRPGDKLFGPDGKVCRVIAINDVVVDGECYEIEFDDGTSIQCNGDHIWPVQRHTRRRKKGGGRVYRENINLTAREISRHDHRPDRRYAVAVNDPLDLPQAELPLAPYVLGAWLGDGGCGSTRITSALDDADEMESLIAATGIDVSRTCHSNAVSLRIGTGIRGQKGSSDVANSLRALGVYREKSIPASYLRASTDQRLALLQGLMDTDGTCNTRGTATFCNTNDRLIDGVYELASTLGLKPMKRRHSGKYLGKSRTFWNVSFQAYESMPPFRMERKRARCKPGARKNPRRFIVDCRRVPTVPMRCIQVDRQDGCYLTGRAMVTTHNSTIITFAGAIQEILRNPEITIGVFAATNKVAKPFLAQIKRELEDNDVLKARYPDVLWANPRKEAPVWSVQEGIVVKRQGNPKELTLEAHGLIDGMPTGRHFGLRIYDDVVTREMVTDQMIPKVTEARELSDNLGGGDNWEWNVGTRYSFADTYGILIERGVVKERRYPATKDGRKDGEPVLFSAEKWEEKKRNQPSQLAAQMLQNPAAGEESTFDPLWLKSVMVRPRTVNCYIIADPSKGPSAGRRSDRTGMAVLLVDAAENIYLVDGYRHRMNLEERWTALKMLHRKWSNTKGVQSVRVGYEQYGMQSDLEHFEFRMRKDKYPFAIEEVSWPREGPGSKIDRVERLVPDFSKGRFHLNGVVHHEVFGTCTWAFDEGQNKVIYTPLQGLSKAQRRIRDAGEPDRILKPIKRRDENGQAYDLTRTFIEEYLFFPFGAHDDLIDAVDRVHDMDISPPRIFEAGAGDPDIYEDGV